MQSVQRQRTAGIFLTYGTQLVHIVIMLIYTPVMLRILGQAEYGLYQLVQAVISSLGMLSFGFSGTYLRFYTRFAVQNDNDGIARLNGMFISVFTCVSLLTLFCGWLIIQNIGIILPDIASSQETDTARILVFFLILAMALSFPLSVFECNIIAHEQFIFQRGLGLLNAILNPFLALPLLFLGYGSVSLVVVTFALTCFRFFLCLLVCLRKNAMFFSFRRFDWRLFQEVWIFSFWIFLNFLTDQINWSAGRFILGKEVGVTAVAVFAVGMTINQMYLTISTAVSSVYAPLVNQIVCKNNDNALLTNLFIRVGRSQFFILTYIVGGFIILGKFFISLWAGKDYCNAYYVALLLIIPVTIPLIQNLGIEIMKAKNMHKFRSIIYIIGAFCNIVTAFICIQYWQEIGAALGTCFALLICNGVIINWYYQTHVEIDIISFWKEIISITPSVLTPILCVYGLSTLFPVQSISSFILLGLLYSVLYLVSLMTIGFNQQEKLFCYSFIKSLKKLRGRHG